MNQFRSGSNKTLEPFQLLWIGLLLVLVMWLIFWASIKQVDGGTISGPNWTPEYLGIGMSDLPSPPPLFTMPAGVEYRQQYLSGGAGTGWTNWNNNGDFAKFYIEDSISRGMTPIFTYYMICQSGHGGAGNGSHPCYSQEQNTIRDNLANSATMNGYWADLKIFYEKAAQFPDQTVILHVEPDMWGHLHQLSANDDVSNYGHAVQVGGSGHPDLAGIADTPQGFVDGLYRLRDVTGAQNVLIGYHVSMWGTLVDFALANPSPQEMQGLAEQSVTFYQSLGREFDLSFFEIRDRDAGFYEVQWGMPDVWWQQNDWDNHITWITRYSADTGQSVMLWQLPYGNTQRAEMDNSWGHYRDNIVETLLGESDYSTLNRYVDAGVIAIVFGQGASGTTCPCDSNGDGRVDDGGYFNEVASRYLDGNQISLNGFAPKATKTPAGLFFTWNDIQADSYEIWSGSTSSINLGSDCSGSANCEQVFGTSHTLSLPNGIDSQYYLLVARRNGTIEEQSAVFQAIRLTQATYLPLLR